MAIETLPGDRERVAPRLPAAPGPVPSEPGIPPSDPPSYRLKRRLLGQPLHSEGFEHQRLGKPTAQAGGVRLRQPVVSAYGTEEILHVIPVAACGLPR